MAGSLNDIDIWFSKVTGLSGEELGVRRVVGHSLLNGVKTSEKRVMSSENCAQQESK